MDPLALLSLLTFAADLASEFMLTFFLLELTLLDFESEFTLEEQWKLSSKKVLFDNNHSTNYDIPYKYKWNAIYYHNENKDFMA